MKRITKNIQKDEEVRFTKQLPVYPRIRFQRELRKIHNDNDDVQITEVVPSHPRNRFQRAIRNTPAKISVDKNVLEDLPYFNANIKVNETNKIRRKEAIFDKIIKQLPPNNDRYYVKHNKKTDTFTVKKDPKPRPMKCKLITTTLVTNKIKNKYAKKRRNTNT